MPFLSLKTNATISDPKALAKQLSQIVAKSTGKPESYVAVSVQKVDAMSFAGSDQPCAVLKLECIGAIKGRQNQHAAAITTAISQSLKIDGNRIFLNFEDVQAANWAMNGSTFG